MNISTKTWHYKLNNWVNKKLGIEEGCFPTKTLCGYFWFTVANIFMATLINVGLVLYTVLWPVIALLGLLCGFVPTSFFPPWRKYKPFQIRSTQFYPSVILYPILITTGIYLSWLLALGNIAGFIMMSILLSIVVGQFIWIIKTASYVEDHHSTVFQAGLDDKPSEFNLLKEYVKTKKSKVCPLIKFVDE